MNEYNPSQFGEFDCDDEFADFVPAVYARDLADAQRYRDLLEDHDIPVLLAGDEADLPSSVPAGAQGMTRGVPVLVPEDFLDEASEIISEVQDEEGFVDVEDAEFDEDDDEDDDDLYGMQECDDEDLYGDEGEDEDEDDEPEDFDDDLSTCHRAHASTVGVTAHLSPCVAGRLVPISSSGRSIGRPTNYGDAHDRRSPGRNAPGRLCCPGTPRRRTPGFRSRRTRRPRPPQRTRPPSRPRPSPQ